MQTELSHREVKGLFLAALDQDLDSQGERLFRAHLDGCSDCRSGWQRYSRAAMVLRRAEREKAPPALSSLILRRVRRRRSIGPRGLALAHAHYRVPAEAIVPILIGVLVAAFLVLIAP